MSASRRWFVRSGLLGLVLVAIALKFHKRPPQPRPSKPVSIMRSMVSYVREREARDWVRCFD